MREYLHTHPNEYELKSIDVKSVDIASVLSKQNQQKLRGLYSLYDMGFASNTNTFPPVMEDVEPHMFKFKEGAEPVYETRPAFPPDKSQVISE